MRHPKTVRTHACETPFLSSVRTTYYARHDSCRGRAQHDSGPVRIFWADRPTGLPFCPDRLTARTYQEHQSRLLSSTGCGGEKPQARSESAFVGADRVALDRSCPQRGVAQPALNEMRRNVRWKAATPNPFRKPLGVAGVPTMLAVAMVTFTQRQAVVTKLCGGGLCRSRQDEMNIEDIHLCRARN